MIPAERLILEVANHSLKDNFGRDQFPEPVLIDLDRLQKELASKVFNPAEYLDPRELATFQGFKYQKRKVEWLGGRLAAKLAVLDLTGREPTAGAMRESVISADQHGKPFLIGPAPPPELSISHSQGLALAMAVSNKACGLDIQKISAATVRVKEKFCTPAEEEIISSLDRSMPPPAALSLLWSGKEALRKARGGHPLTGFTAMRLTGAVEASPESWLLTMRAADDTYRILTFFHKDFATAICLLPKP